MAIVMKHIKGVCCLLLSFLLLCLCGACGDGYKNDGAFTYLLARNVDNLDPQTASGESAWVVIGSVFEGLCRIDEDGQVVPGVAKKWEANYDDTEFTFYLRGGAKWSDGTPVTADDFVFAMQRALRPETATPSVDDLFILRGAREVYNKEIPESSLGVFAKDELTLVVQLEKSYADFPALTAGSHYMPCNRAYFEESAGHYGLSSEYLITNGPFTFTNRYSWVTESGKRAISLSRSESYKGPHEVRPASLQFLIDYDPALLENPVESLASGQADILTLSQSLAEQAEAQGGHVQVLDDAGTGLLLNPRAQSLEEPVVREMFLKTLDRQSLLDRRRDKEAQEAMGIMPSCVVWNTSSYYADGARLYAQQDDTVLERLPSLLEMLEQEKLPSISVLCPDDPESVDIANGFLVSWNQKLGNAFNIQPLPEEEMKSRVASGDYEAALYTLRAGGTTPYQVLKSFESTSYPSLLEDEEFDAQLHSLTFELSSYRRLENYLLESYIFYPLFSDKTYYAAGPGTRGIAASPDLSVNFITARKKG